MYLLYWFSPEMHLSERSIQNYNFPTKQMPQKTTLMVFKIMEGSVQLSETKANRVLVFHTPLALMLWKNWFDVLATAAMQMMILRSQIRCHNYICSNCG